jgi:predicted regulator of Ras-like GTPase activity (Roadblock/LC7/MglB family)
LLLDATGEVAMEAGSRDERYRLVGAYQGIALGHVQRTFGRHDGGRVREVCCRYDQGYVLMRPLKDGYYLVLVLGPEASIALGRLLLRPAQAKMTQEL